MSGRDEFDLTRGGEQDEAKAPVLSFRRRGRPTAPPGAGRPNSHHRHLTERVQAPLATSTEPAASSSLPLALDSNREPTPPAPPTATVQDADPVQTPVRSPRRRVSLAKIRPIAVLSGAALAALIAGGIVIGIELLNLPSAHRTASLSAARSRSLSQHSEQPILTAGQADAAVQHPRNATHRSTLAIRRTRDWSLRHTQPRQAMRLAHASRPAAVYVATSRAAQPTRQATQPTYTTPAGSTTTSGAEATPAPTSSRTSSAATRASRYNGRVSAAGPTESGPPAPGGPPAP
jgi:hypothetical protein